MNMFVSRLVVLFWFRETRGGLSINGPKGKHIRTGMMVPIECHSDSYGIVFEFTHRSVTQSVPIAECEFKKDNLSTAFFMTDDFESVYNITQTSRTCILTILSLTEDQCGTYSCTELYIKSVYVYWNISCNGERVGTTRVTSTPGMTKFQPDPGRTRTLIGQILGVVAFMIFISCLLCMAYRKCSNTITLCETGDFTHECGRFISQETGQDERYNPPVIPRNIGVNYTEHEIIADCSNSSREYIDWNCPDSIEMQEAHNNSEELNIGQSVDKSDTSSENSIISLKDLSAGPYVLTVIDDNNMGTENVPSCDRKEETKDSAIEERVIYERRNAYLPYARTISERVFGEITEVLLSK